MDLLASTGCAIPALVLAHARSDPGPARWSHFHRCGPPAHVGIAEDHMKPAVAARVHMRLIARVDQGTTIHRVDAHHPR